MDKPKVVVMCGSSRFVEEMAVCEWLIESQELAITMGLNLLPWWYSYGLKDHLAEFENCAGEMDTLHLRKIDLADEIFVVDGDVDGKPYIGSSTSNEVAYARKKGIPIRKYSETPLFRIEVGERMLAGIEAHKQTSESKKQC